MKYSDVMLIAVALAIDASAMAISNCTIYKSSITRKKQLAMPVLFAIFQGLMPLIGFYVATLFSSSSTHIMDFLSSAIFFVLSAKIFVEIFKNNKQIVFTIKEAREKSKKQKTAVLSFSILLIQGIATSIDALVVGITLSNLAFSIMLAMFIIALITFIMVSVSLLLGKHFEFVFGKYSDLVGAIILLFLAIKSLIKALL